MLYKIQPVSRLLLLGATLFLGKRTKVSAQTEEAEPALRFQLTYPVSAGLPRLSWSQNASSQLASLMESPAWDLTEVTTTLEDIYSDSGGAASWTSSYSVSNPNFTLTPDASIVAQLTSTPFVDLLSASSGNATLAELEEGVTASLCMSVPWFTPQMSYCVWEGISCCLFSRLGACQAGVASIQVLKLIGKHPQMDHVFSLSA